MNFRILIALGVVVRTFSVASGSQVGPLSGCEALTSHVAASDVPADRISESASCPVGLACEADRLPTPPPTSRSESSFASSSAGYINEKWFNPETGEGELKDLAEELNRTLNERLKGGTVSLPKTKDRLILTLHVIGSETMLKGMDK